MSSKKSTNQLAAQHVELRVVHGVVGALFALMAVVFGTFGPHSVITLGYGTVKELATEQQLVFVPVLDVTMRSLIVVYLLLASFHHVIVCLPGLFPTYIQSVAAGVNGFRWMEYAVSASVMMVVLGVLTGIREVLSLMLMAMAMSTTNLFGWMAELTPNRWAAHLFGWVPHFASWAAVWFGYFNIDPEVASMEVTWLVPVMFAFFNAFGVVQMMHKFNLLGNYVRVEYVYTLLSLLAKSMMATTVFYGSFTT